jgi:hypothetical protein
MMIMRLSRVSSVTSVGRKRSNHGKVPQNVYFFLPNFAKFLPYRNLVFLILGAPSEGSEALRSPASILGKQLGKVSNRLRKQLGKVRQS